MPAVEQLMADRSPHALKHIQHGIQYGRPNAKNSEPAGLIGVDEQIHKPLNSLYRLKAQVSRSWHEAWGSEVFHLLLGILCIAGIAILLGVYDEAALPLDLPFGITLGAFVSTLATIAKYALAVPLDESLGCLKWLWYQHTPQPLLDFEKFDNAARDPVSATQLFCRTKHRSLASLGSVVILLSLAIDPFLQQVINISQRSSLENLSRVPRVVNMTRHTDLLQNGVEAIASQAQVFDAVGVFYLPTNVSPNFTTFCPNTDCSWPTFDTLAICSSCKDISSELGFGCRKEPGEWKMDSGERPINGSVPSFSCGWFFNLTSDRPMLMSGYSLDTNDGSYGQTLLMRQLNMRDPLTDETFWNGSINFRATPNPLANFAIVATPDVPSIFANATPAAHECVMQWCTKRIAASFSGGSYHERVLSDFRNMSARAEALTVQNTSFGLDYIYGQNISLTPPGHPETFFVTNTSMLKMRFAFDRFMPSYLTVPNGATQSHLRYENDVGPDQGQISAKVDCRRWLSPNGIPYTVEQMALGLSSALRTTQYSEPVFGSGVLETYVQVRWTFFSLPVAVVTLTSLLLGSTIWQMRGSRSASRSSLFTLMHGLSPMALQALGESQSLHDIRSCAKLLAVIWNDQDDNAQLEIVP